MLAVLAGASFGLGGAAFQTLLLSPLASPDIIGISAVASASAVFCIVVLSVTGPVASIYAVAAGIGVAVLIYLLAWRSEVTGARLILVGIGLSAMLQSLGDAQTLDHPPGITVQWLTRDEGLTPLAALDLLQIPQGTRSVFIAAEAARARDILADRGLDRSEIQSAAYWTKT